MNQRGPFVAITRDIHDGDTVGLDIDLGFGNYLLTKNPITGSRELSCRLYRCYAAELGTQAGALALEFLQKILPINSVVEVTSYGWDKYGGRFDGSVILNGVNINELMIASGHATPTPVPLLTKRED